MINKNTQKLINKCESQYYIVILKTDNEEYSGFCAEVMPQEARVHALRKVQGKVTLCNIGDIWWPPQNTSDNPLGPWKDFQEDVDACKLVLGKWYLCMSLEACFKEYVWAPWNKHLVSVTIHLLREKSSRCVQLCIKECLLSNTSNCVRKRVS